MPTIQQVITRSMRLIGAIESGETPTADELADGLTALQSMLNGWRTNRLAVYANSHESFTLVPGTGTYTVGPAGTFVTTRPMKIQSAYVRSGGIDFPVKETDQYQWALIADKSTSGDYPTKFNYEPTLPAGTLKLHPVPSAAHTLYLVRQVELDDSYTLSDNLDFPPGYERAIVYNLALEIAPEFEAQVSNLVMGIARTALGDIQRRNGRQIQMRPEFTGADGSSYDIQVDA